MDINNLNEFQLSKYNTESNIIKEEKKKNSFKDNNFKDLYPNIEISVNGIEYNNIDNIININDEKNNKIIENINEFYISEKKEKNIAEDIENLILNLKKSFEKYSSEIKYNIDKEFIEDMQNHGIKMKLELNKIMSEISLFENNYKDFLNMIN